jgi:hypothetical protein
VGGGGPDGYEPSFSGQGGGRTGSTQDGAATMDDALRGAGDGAARRSHTQAPAPSPSDLASEDAHLSRENERLWMERDIQKRAALIFGATYR